MLSFNRCQLKGLRLCLRGFLPLLVSVNTRGEAGGLVWAWDRLPREALLPSSLVAFQVSLDEAAGSEFSVDLAMSRRRCRDSEVPSDPYEFVPIDATRLMGDEK